MSDPREPPPQTTIDVLTGLGNHDRFQEFLAIEWLAAQQAGDVISLLAIDLDHFQAFIEAYGRQGGDDCLARVGGVLKNRIRRSSDLPARRAGEQFAVVLPGTPAAGAGPVAEAVRRLVQELRIPHSGSAASPHVSVSVGIASVIPEPGSQPEALITAAEAALTRAKADGGNRVCGDAPA